jgi:hypothetical protein
MKITTPYIAITSTHPLLPPIVKDTTLLKMIKASITGTEDKKKKLPTKIQKKSTHRLKLLLLLLKVKNSPILPNFSSTQEIDFSKALSHLLIANVSLVLILSDSFKLFLEKNLTHKNLGFHENNKLSIYV